jgi:hypothetical protein
MTISNPYSLGLLGQAANRQSQQLESNRHYREELDNGRYIRDAMISNDKLSDPNEPMQELTNKLLLLEC